MPFVLPEGTDPDQLELVPPFNFGDSIIIEQPDGREAIITLNKAAFFPTVADRENNTRYLLDVEELQQLTEEATQQGLFEPLNLSANYTMNGTETIVSSSIIIDVRGFQALEEEGEQLSAANITTATTATNATDSNATAVITTPIPPTLTRQENTTTTEGEEEEEEEEEP